MPEPSCARDGPGVVRHMVTLEPSPARWQVRRHGTRGDDGAFRIGRRVWSRGTCGDTRALSWQVAFPMPRGTW
jgi:hypothetical protein